MIGLFSTAGFSQNNWSLSGNALGTGNPNGYFLGTTDANPIIFKTNNVEYLRILSNGNTGIGLTNPKYSLALYSPGDSLVGSISVGSMGMGTNGGISFPPPLNPHHVGFTAFQITNYSTGQTKKAGALLYLLGEDFGIKNDSGNIYLAAKNNDVAMSGSNASISAVSSGNGSSIGLSPIKITSNTHYSYTTADSVLFMIDGDGTAHSFISMKQGRLGINTQYPQATLDVNGYGRFVSSSSSSDYIRIGHDGAHSIIDAFGSGGLLIDYYSGKEIDMGTGATKADVHIGKDLYVCGNIQSNEVTVQTGWCDYVFNKNYKLMPLSKVENYINQNHHLPGMLSAKRIESKGLHLAATTKAQQEKIEDLYLYIIKQQKEIDALKAELKSPSIPQRGK